MTPAGTVPVLVYHSVGPDPVDGIRRWNVSGARFREHLDLLVAEGYTTLTVADYARRLRDGAALPIRCALVTFDDGFADLVDHAVPELLATGVVATVYVSTAYVGGASRWLGPGNAQAMATWKQVAHLDAVGIEVGAHAHHHVALDEIGIGRARAEIVRSRDELRAHLDREIATFAYPFGYHDRHLKQVVESADFLGACAVKNTLSGPGDDRFAISRILVEDNPSAEELHRLLRGAARPRSTEAVSTRAWRTVRRARRRISTGTLPRAAL